MADKQKSVTVCHFVQEGRNKQTIYSIVKRYEEFENRNFKSMPSRPASQSTPRTVRKVKRLFEKKPSTSVAIAAQKLSLTKSTLSRIGDWRKSINQGLKDMQNYQHQNT